VSLRTFFTFFVCDVHAAFTGIDVELRLSGVPAARRKSTSQKHQPCASLLIRLRAPPSSVLDDEDEDEDEDGVSLVSSGEC
jgi:hypothetical protein